MAYAGIDYGMGTANRDPETGIRYGVISQNSVGQAWYDSAEADYGEPTCPKCGNKALAYDGDSHNEYAAPANRRYACADYACEECKILINSEDAFGDEPAGWNYSGDGYELTDCLDNDIFVLKSPFYTFAQFCSPCVPGAGNLDNAMEDGAKTFCLGHDWFEEGKAPYRLYRVDTGEEVLFKGRNGRTRPSTGHAGTDESQTLRGRTMSLPGKIITYGADTPARALLSRVKQRATISRKSFAMFGFSPIGVCAALALAANPMQSAGPRQLRTDACPATLATAITLKAHWANSAQPLPH